MAPRLGLEPRTSKLTALRYYQLSYRGIKVIIVLSKNNYDNFSGLQHNSGVEFVVRRSG